MAGEENMLASHIFLNNFNNVKDSEIIDALIADDEARKINEQNY